MLQNYIFIIMKNPPLDKFTASATRFYFVLGVGRIIAECEKPPLVVPIWHVGMFAFMYLCNY